MTTQKMCALLVCLCLLARATGARAEILVDDFSDAASPSVYPYFATLGMTSGLVLDSPVNSAIGGSRLQVLFATLTDPPRDPTPLDHAAVDIDTQQGLVNISGSENLAFSWNIVWQDAAETETLDLDITAETGLSIEYVSNVAVAARIFVSNAGGDGVSTAGNIVELMLPSSSMMQTLLIDLADISDPIFASPGNPLPDLDPTSVDGIIITLETIEENADVSLSRVAFVPEPCASLLWCWSPVLLAWGRRCLTNAHAKSTFSQRTLRKVEA